MANQNVETEENKPIRALSNFAHFGASLNPKMIPCCYVFHHLGFPLFEFTLARRQSKQLKLCVRVGKYGDEIFARIHRGG